MSLLQSGCSSNSLNYNTYSWHGFPFPAHRNYQRSDRVFDLLTCDPTYYCIRPRNLLYIKRCTKIGTWPDWGLHHSEGTDLTEQWIGLTKVQRKHQLRSDILPEGKTFLQDIVYTWSQQLCMICSHLVDYMGTGPRSRNRSGLFTITFKNPLGKFCVSHPHNSDLCVSRGSGSKEGILPPEDIKGHIEL